jgi:hypothetical protein
MGELTNVDSLESFERLLSDFREFTRDLSLSTIALYLNVDQKTLRNYSKDRRALLRFLERNENRIRFLMRECEENAVNGKKILDSLLARGVSPSQVAVMLKYKGNDYADFLERLKSRRFWDYETYENVMALKSEDVFLKNENVPPSIVEGIKMGSLFISLVFELGCAVEGARREKFPLQFLVRTTVRVSEEISERFSLPFPAVLFVILEKVKKMVGRDVTEPVLIYLKRGGYRNKEVLAWLKKDDQQKNAEVGRAKMCLEFLFENISEVVGSIVNLIKEKSEENSNFTSFVGRLSVFCRKVKDDDFWKEVEKSAMQSYEKK